MRAFFGRLRKARREQIAAPERRRPTWLEILSVAAQSRGLSPSDAWLSMVAAKCEAIPGRDEAIDLAEQELQAFEQAEASA